MTDAERNRQQMPETAKVIDEFRRVFGPVKVKWCAEGEHERGKVPDAAH